MTSPRKSHRPFTIASLCSTLVLLAGNGAVPAAAAADSRPPISATATMAVPGTPNEVFSLFTPEGRSVWDPEWEIEITSPGRERRDGPGARFQFQGKRETVWEVVALDTERRMLDMKYVRPDQLSMAVRIVCAEAEPGHVTVAVTYTAIAPSDVMQRALGSALAHQIEDLVVGKDGWRDRLTHYLREGVRWVPFEPVAIERQHVAHLDAPPDQLLAIANPAGGNHWTTGTPDYLFGSPEEPSGAMWRSRDRWFLVADYDSITRSIKTVLLIPEIEFMIEELRFDPAPEGGTTMHVTWRVAGLPPGGNEAVEAFFDRAWDHRMAMIEESYRSQLKRDADSP